jgi:hypothetical protein
MKYSPRAHPLTFGATPELKGGRYIVSMADRGTIARCVKATPRLRSIFSMLATGWLPWGFDWDHGDGFPNLPWCPPHYIMCCGHVLTVKRAQQLVSAGLLDAGKPDRFGRPTLVITWAGRTWLEGNWPS